MNNFVRILHEKLLPYPQLYAIAKSCFEWTQDTWGLARLRKVRIHKLLVGGENGIPGPKYSRLTGNLARCSRSIIDSPHVQFLQLYGEVGEHVLERQMLVSTEYYQNALEAIDLCGYYFGARQESEIVNVAREFINNFLGTMNAGASKGASRKRGPVIVARIGMSDGCYEIVDGHHRLAIACVQGERHFPVFVSRKAPSSTPMQDLLMDCLWTRGEQICYQPLDFPETQTWHLVRNCGDRFALMKKWCIDKGLVDDMKLSYLDVGCSYGWFVKSMKNLGFVAKGVERDTAAIKVGQAAYGLQQDAYITKEIVNFCSGADQKYDVVSCFSVLHHFVLGKSHVSAEQFIRYLDNLTETVLFLDTGQAHEQWFKSTLSEWSNEYIERWIMENTSFNFIERLGKDSDDVGKFAENYGRTLYVCRR